MTAVKKAKSSAKSLSNKEEPTERELQLEQEVLTLRERDLLTSEPIFRQQIVYLLERQAKAMERLADATEMSLQEDEEEESED